MTAAATGSPARGAVAMLVFGAGTIPVLVVLGPGSARLGAGARLLFHRVGAAEIGVVAVQLLLRGMAALGVVGHLRLGELVLWWLTFPGPGLG